MSRKERVGKGMVAILMVSIVLVALAGCSAKPDSVATKLAETVNAQDLEGALKLFSEDAVVDSGGPVPFSGQEEIQGWLEGMMADNLQIEIEILEVTEDRVLERDTMTMDSLSELGLDSLVGTSEITVQDGKITALAFVPNEESARALQVATLEASVPTHADLPYHEDGDPMHSLDVYLPQGAEGALPTLVIVPGAESTKDDFGFLAGYFAGQGYAAVPISFRARAKMDAQDTACALGWVHANAEEYGFDPQRIVLLGYSVGGLAAATVGAADDTSLLLEGCAYSLPEAGWTQGVATFASVTVTPEACLTKSWCLFGTAQATGLTLPEMEEIFGEMNETPPAKWRESGALSETAKDFAQFVPLYWVDGSEPPFLLVHGDADQMVPPGESEAFAAYLQEAGGQAELLLLPGAGHLSIVPSSPSFPTFVEAVDDFVTNLPTQ